MLNVIQKKIAWLISVMLQPQKVIRVVVTNDAALNQKINNLNNRRKASLRSRRGQITTEYFIVAAAIATVTVLGTSYFQNHVKLAVQDFINVAAERFAH